jgi:hypothetical protein
LAADVTSLAGGTMALRFFSRAEFTDLEHQSMLVAQILARLEADIDDAASVTIQEIEVGNVRLEQVDIEQPAHGGADRAVLLRECRYWLGAVQAFVGSWWTRFYQLDLAWNAMREIRHRFCWLLPPDELGRNALDIREDFTYLDAGRQKAAGERWERVMQLLTSSSADLPACRAELLDLSLLGGNAKQEHWHRVNLLRARLQATGLVAFGVTLALVLAVAILPRFGVPVDLANDPKLAQPPYVILGVVVFGAIGGFISAVQRHEPLVGTSSVFYRERLFLWLRPIVGTTAALILYLAQISKAIVLFQQPPSPAFYWFVAFCTGFSERFFLSKLEDFLKRKDCKKKGEDGADAGA